MQHLHQTEQGGEDKGEPEHQVDLLVDDVDGQGADAFVIDPLTPKTSISQATTRGNTCEDKTVRSAKERKEERT